MNNQNQHLLEAILTAQVLLLSREIDRECRETGFDRLGGDYTQEATALIRQHCRNIVGAFTGQEPTH